MYSSAYTCIHINIYAYGKDICTYRHAYICTCFFTDLLCSCNGQLLINYKEANESFFFFVVDVFFIFLFCVNYKEQHMRPAEVWEGILHHTHTHTCTK